MYSVKTHQMVQTLETSDPDKFPLQTLFTDVKAKLDPHVCQVLDQMARMDGGSLDTSVMELVPDCVEWLTSNKSGVNKWSYDEWVAQIADDINTAQKSSIEHGLTGQVLQATGARLAAEKTVGPNSPCPCGSGKKYKKCCGNH